MLRRADRFFAERGRSIDDVVQADFDAFVATLPASRSSVAAARSALQHYWSATGRRDAPELDLSVALGRNGQNPATIAAARARAADLARAHGLLPAVSWADVAYSPLWLRNQLLARGLAPRSVTSYLGALRRVRTWCEAHGTTIDAMTASELEEYAAGVSFSRSARMQLRTALEHYWAIAGRPEPPTYAVRVPRKPRMVARPLEHHAAEQLLRAALARNDLPGLAVVIALFTGLRRFELAKLQWADFSDDGWLSVIGKRDVAAKLPVHPVVRDYLARTPRLGPFLFPGRSGGSLSAARMWSWVRAVTEEAGLGKVGTHVLRHTALSVANDATGDLRAVQEFARHASPDTTAGYTKVTAERLVRVAEALGNAYGGHLPAGPGGGARFELVPFELLVRTVEGRHAVAAWRELADALAPRAGWRLDGDEDGAGICFAYGSRLRATVVALPGSPARFCLGELDDELGLDLRFDTARELAALLEQAEGLGTVPGLERPERAAEPDMAEPAPGVLWSSATWDGRLRPSSPPSSANSC
jgi:integrase